MQDAEHDCPDTEARAGMNGVKSFLYSTGADSLVLQRTAEPSGPASAKANLASAATFMPAENSGWMLLSLPAASARRWLTRRCGSGQQLSSNAVLKEYSADLLGRASEARCASHPWRSMNRPAACTAASLGVSDNGSPLHPATRTIEDYSSSLMPSSSPEPFFGSGGHHVCGSGRPSALAFAKIPLWTVAPLAIPGHTPSRSCFRQRRIGIYGERYG